MNPQTSEQTPNNTASDMPTAATPVVNTVLETQPVGDAPVVSVSTLPTATSQPAPYPEMQSSSPVPEQTPAMPAQPVSEPIEWEASEYIHHEKDMVWFVGLIIGAIALGSVAVFLLHSWTFAALIVVMVVAVIVLARRPPRSLRYRLSGGGIQIGSKQYAYHEFKAFGVVEDGPIPSIALIPVKRFMPSVTLYFPPDHGEVIVDTLGSAMPMEQIKPDFVDRLTKNLRF